MDKELLVTINNKIAEQVIVEIESSDYAKVITACSEIIDSSQVDGKPLVQRTGDLYNLGVGYLKQNRTKNSSRPLAAFILHLPADTEFGIQF